MEEQLEFFEVRKRPRCLYRRQAVCTMECCQFAGLLGRCRDRVLKPVREPVFSEVCDAPACE